VEAHPAEDYKLGLNWFRSAGEGELRLDGCIDSTDTFVFELELGQVREAYLGPAGAHVNFGGVDEQEFLMYWGHAGYQKQDGGMIAVDTGTAAAVLVVHEGTLRAAESGYVLTAPSGTCRIAVAVGVPGEAAVLKERALAASEANVRVLMENASSRERELHEKIPDGIARDYRPAVEAALWTIATSTVKAQGNMRHEFLGACPTAYDKAQWLWDACFSVRGYAAYDVAACEGWMRNFMDAQREDGMLPGCISPTWIDEATQVPIFTWAVLEMHRAGAGDSFLEEACEAARRNNDWWMMQADEACGSLPSSTPISYDNSPLFDFCRIERMKTGERLVTPDMVACLIQDCEDIAQLARLLGKSELEAHMLERKAQLSRAAWAHLYNAQTGFFDVLSSQGRKQLKTGQALMGIRFCPPEVADEIVERYLQPGTPAWRRIGITTTFSDEPSYDPENFWRGMVWPGVNRLVAEALLRSGKPDDAVSLARHTLGFMVDNDSFYEVYNPETGCGSRASSMSGLGAGVFLDFLNLLDRVSHMNRSVRK
jgi:glycogen debranching enzyme